MYHMHKKLQEGSEGAVILTGSSDKLLKTAAAFVRIQEACDFQEMLEVPVRLRFFIIIMIPPETGQDTSNSPVVSVCDIGAHFGALLSDEVSRAAKEAKQTPRKTFLPEDTGGGHEEVSAGLVRTGKLFGGLISDIKRKIPWYKGDYMDALNPHGIGQCLATSIFLFFALLTNIVTFGGVMEKQLHSEMAVLETIVAGLVCGVVFALFSGQPMNILSATGPVLVFEKILYKICEGNGWNFMAGRFWVGIWTCIILILIVATDMSALVALITRFTEECFATLIALLFIVQAFEEIFDVAHEAPLTKDPQALLDSPCVCYKNSSVSYYTNASVKMQTKEYCLETSGTVAGMQCTFQPDVFLMSFILFFGTFLLIVFLKNMKTSSFFPSKVRMLLSDFSSFLAILVMTCISNIVDLKMPKLKIPTKIQPTSGRNWLVSPFHEDVPMFLPFVCIVPALLFSILVFMDQQITAVIVNRKDNKLKKGFGYHLDLFILSLLFIVCSLFGIPFFVAATVLSIVHVQSLRVESETAAPGEKPQFLGIREQRLTAMLSAILIGLSVFMAHLIKLIPTPVLYGVFLFMGYSSLQGQQLMDRIRLVFIPPKYQPDYVYLRVVPMLRVHLYTGIQLLSLALLFVIKNIKTTSMLFPLMLIVIVAIRKLLEKIFDMKELDALDHRVPTWKQLNAGRESTLLTCYKQYKKKRSKSAVSDATPNDIPTVAPVEIRIEDINTDNTMETTDKTDNAADKVDKTVDIPKIEIKVDSADKVDPTDKTDIADEALLEEKIDIPAPRLAFRLGSGDSEDIVDNSDDIHSIDNVLSAADKSHDINNHIDTTTVFDNDSKKC